MNENKKNIAFNEALKMLMQILQKNRDILYRLKHENVLVHEPSHMKN